MPHQRNGTAHSGDDVLPAAELVGLPARDEGLREVGARLVARPGEHECIQGL